MADSTYNFLFSLFVCIKNKTIKGTDIMNIVFVNPWSCGGKGIGKWERIRPYLKDDSNSFILNGKTRIKESIRDYYNHGITNFIAAGGDGTVNLLLNNLVNSLSPEELRRVSLGAIGIGSSNDFHKPFFEAKQYEGIPFRIDFNKAQYRDVGCVSYLDGSVRNRKYFIINASAGITAEANHLFNNPDIILSWLKKRNTGFAIIYTALKTILRFTNFTVSVSTSDGKKFITQLTNLGITKNPNFSGNLRYNSSADYTNGIFDLFLCSDMSKYESIKLLELLSKGNFDKVKKKQCWQADELNLHSEKKFFVEYDGEIILTDNVSFSVLPRFLKVCQC
jgi:diacylglycerol kinase (ATP)